MSLWPTRAAPDRSEAISGSSLPASRRDAESDPTSVICSTRETRVMSDIPTIRKYPRTPHLEGSRPQPGDEDLDVVPVTALAGKHVVVEEKLDGANVGISVGPDGPIRVQSRGHVLAGGPRERQFDLLKTWIACHQNAIASVLGQRYVM